VLTADLVSVRRRGDELRLAPVDDGRRAHIEALAAALVRVARAHVGSTREAVDDALDGAARDAAGGGAGADQRLTNAVLKLVRDGCRFDEPDPEPAQALRRDVFRRAAAARRAATALAPFDRAALLAGVAAERGIGAADVEAGLFADRPAYQRLLAFEGASPAALAAGFTLAQAQAVLLRAT
jgi:predicted nuclease of restriction endonuclease-like RecB superfamily